MTPRTAPPILLLLALTAAGVGAQPGIRTQRVPTASADAPVRLKGRIHGSETVDYLVRVAAGQELRVSLKGSNAQNYFNVLPPERRMAWFVGQDGSDFRGIAPGDGEYAIRVYLMRPAARRREASAFTLVVGVTGQALRPLPASQDALVPGTKFHASAKITCSTMIDPAAHPCDAFVVRRGHDGTATVEVRGRDGYRRRILFIAGRPVSSDATDAISASRRGDVTVIALGTDERFEIPDALLTGG